MASPPGSLPSPAPSSSSSAYHPQSFASMSQIQPPPVRAASATSHISATSGRDSKFGGHFSNGSAPGEAYSPPSDYPGLGDPGMSAYAQQTPQGHAMPFPGGGYAEVNPNTFLPQVTASPPPHAPPYFPPPQHAMAPDPIHSMPMGMMMGASESGMLSPTGMAWPHGPGQWRPGPSHYSGQQQLGRPNQPMANGHVSNLQHQLPPNPLDAYGSPRSAVPVSGMPSGMPPPSTAMLHHAILGANGPGRPASAHGEARERRRDRERRERDEEIGERENGREEPEVISTIFVVGFPDDMSEREFQNAFTFAPGFEAATLKFPSGSNRREPTAALLAELTQIAAGQNVAGEHGEAVGTGPLEDALAALQMGGTTTTSSSTTPSAAISLTPSAPSAATFSGPSSHPQLTTRRQTIGFARFKTRADAIAAREHLQGRKIDSLTGATLKAEMAKKNLHTKRTTSGEEIVGLLLRSGRLQGLVNAAGQQAQQQAMASSLSAGNVSHLAAGSQSSQAQLAYQQQPPSAKEAWDLWPAQQGQIGGEREKAMEDARAVPPSASYPHQSYPYPNHFQHVPQPPNPTSSQSDASTSPPTSITSPNQRPTDSKALLALAEEADELEGWSVGGAVEIGMGLDGFSHRHSERDYETLSSSRPQPIPIMTQHGGLYGHGQQPGLNAYVRDGREVREGGVNFGSSPPGGSDHMSDAGRSMGGFSSAANPADQNAPINTLYVGNLPAISPPTHPPNFLEESLRNLFVRCAGFKRMSFRQKINGPMCFVEFEDVPFASQAIKDLYGHNLGGLVKGGIRLSYSKNSLGQRGSSHPAGASTSMFGGIAHTVALAGMSTPVSNGGGGPGGGPGAGGYPLAPGSGQVSTTQSVPVPTGHQPPPDLRRASEGTSLSPTAQPFNAATSPRSRYFGVNPTGPSLDPNSAGFNSFSPMNNPLPISPQFHANANTNTNMGNGAGPPQQQQQQFSPVSSPIRTPASYSWVSSSGSAGVGNGYGFDPYSGPGGRGMSLGGAASAWGQAGGGNGGPQ